ncbi:hypothetical protein COV13_00965 [Candidatus Woesearchaeota archaeon CG10_big_fil_rev_8_21_14_0_10_32_9]|nr:MAG: hypothetical protein COV13_00965 [Candidatus Woesearchaeota archaeon CG10_big_fil_rev_8_21_14_0_10_32_9]
MANFSTVEGAQLFLNLHFRRNSFAYDFFNTGIHIYEDSSKINLELRLDCHLYTQASVAKMHLLFTRVPEALDAFRNKKTTQTYIDECLQLNDKLETFFSPNKNGKPNFQKLSGQGSNTSIEFSLKDIALQSDQFNEMREIYFKKIKLPGIPTAVGIDSYFFGNKYNKNGHVFLKEEKECKKLFFESKEIL